jgi:hypothetical protein
MQAKERWLAWVLDESAKLDVAMPWERGQRGPAARPIVAPAKPEAQVARSA